MIFNLTFLFMLFVSASGIQDYFYKNSEEIQFATSTKTPRSQAVSLGVSSSSISKQFLVWGGCILIAIMFFYCCQQYMKAKRTRNCSDGHVQSATAEELAEVCGFQRCAFHTPCSENKNKTYIISDNSSCDVFLSRLKCEKNFDVTAALFPTETDGQTISMATIPRSVFPEKCEWSESVAQRIKKLGTKLITRFSSSSSYKSSDVSVFLTHSERRIYSRLSCEEDIPLEAIEHKKMYFTSEGHPSKIPDIVVEFVN